MTNRRAQITTDDLPYLAFIPDFGDKTLAAIKNALPIKSKQELRAALSTMQGSGKKIDFLLALYAFSTKGTPPPQDPLFTDPAKVISIVDGDTFDAQYANGIQERVRPA